MVYNLMQKLCHSNSQLNLLLLERKNVGLRFCIFDVFGFFIHLVQLTNSRDLHVKCLILSYHQQLAHDAVTKLRQTLIQKSEETLQRTRN